MIVKVIIFIVLISSCYGSRPGERKGFGQENDFHDSSIKKIMRFYKDINCVEEKNGKFDCRFVTNMKRDRCYDGSKDYPKGYTHNVSSPCFRDCACTEDSVRNSTKWMCNYEICYEKANDCRKLYNKGSCCSYSSLCGKNVSLKNVEKNCIYHGQSYLYGEYFLTIDDPCTVCYCDENFKHNFTEHACKPVECNVNYLYSNYILSGCTPIFLRSLACCPSQLWLCDGEQTEMKGDKCRFGGNEYEIGEKFKPGGDVSQCVECLCRVPPYLTCVYKEKCGFSNFWNTLYNAQHNFPARF